MKALPRKAVSLIVKAAVTVSLLWWLSRKLDFGLLWGNLLALSPADILLGIALIFCGTILSIVRWSVIMRQIGISIAGAAILRYGLIGYFFNQALPSSIGGDGIRLWLLYRDGIAASLAIRSIFLDRLSGLVFLFLLSLYGMPRLLQQLFGISPLFLAGALICCVLAGIAVLALITRQQSRLDHYRAGRVLVQIVGDLKLLATRNWTLLYVGILSLAAQLLSCGVVWLLVHRFNANVSLVDVLTVTPVIFILLILPITIAGWGLREGLFVAGLALVGVSEDVALISSVVFGVINLLASLVGGVLWIADASAIKQTPGSDGREMIGDRPA